MPSPPIATVSVLLGILWGSTVGLLAAPSSAAVAGPDDRQPGVSVREMLNDLAGRGERNAGEARGSRVLICEGWQESGRLVMDGEGGVIRPRWEPNPHVRRLHLPPGATDIRDALAHLASAESDWTAGVHEESGVLFVIERLLQRSPAWPLNRPLGGEAQRALTLREALEILTRAHGLERVLLSTLEHPESRDEPVWDPTEHGDDPTVRDLVYEILAANPPEGHWCLVGVHLPNFDPSRAEDSLRGVTEIPWVIQAGR